MTKGGMAWLDAALTGPTEAQCMQTSPPEETASSPWTSPRTTSPSPQASMGPGPRGGGAGSDRVCLLQAQPREAGLFLSPHMPIYPAPQHTYTSRNLPQVAH